MLSRHLGKDLGRAGAALQPSNQQAMQKASAERAGFP
jgi:hypothetical protein